VSLVLEHSYFVGNLTNSKIAETKALEPLNPDTFVSAISKLVNSQQDTSGPRLGTLSYNR
jgi:hypothetical protein